MATYSTNQFKSGLKIILDNDPWSVVENEFVKPGKGQAFNRVRIRNLLTGRVIERTFKSGDTVEGADIVEKDMQYLYADDEYWHFMDPNSFEQMQVGKEVMEDAAKWLVGQETCTLTLWNDRPILVVPPNFVILQIRETDPGLRGDTATGGTKPAIMETGAVVKVPLFVEPSDKLKIDTRTGEYVSRG